MSKRGQITIFIIIAIVLVVIVALFFLLRGASFTDTGDRSAAKNLNPVLRLCIGDKVDEGIERLIDNGGYIAPTLKKPFQFSNEDNFNDYTYLCYNLNRENCIPQQPNLIVHSENEMKDYLEEDLKSCFESSLLDIVKEGYIIDQSDFNDFEVSVIDGKIEINIDAKVTTSKGDESFNQEGFEMSFKNNLYDFVNLARQIINSEAETCNFDSVAFMMQDPRINIKRVVATDDAKIYALTHSDEENKFRFAILGC
jgi:hypothetical protein